MIVVDTKVIAYLYLPGDRTEAAEALCREDPEWSAPLLWRSEMRNVLATQIRVGRIELDGAQSIQTEAQQLLDGREFAVDSAEVLHLTAESGCSAYDCEFVVLADYFDVPLYSADRRLVKRFPHRARLLGE
ncbi:MAG: type II toxin-antitoxin system VapC family toxin [Wenzhouxiangellaceae bacterium]|nr:type II toxin-antitoxin system VapC family toxin [Wenzhouxiangellaceae bacterium]